ncbi:unnamed protein product [Cunninghamella echinulata]
MIIFHSQKIKKSLLINQHKSDRLQENTDIDVSSKKLLPNEKKNFFIDDEDALDYFLSDDVHPQQLYIYSFENLQKTSDMTTKEREKNERKENNNVQNNNSDLYF